MGKPFSGGAINYDLNTIGEVKLLRPFGVKANIIVDQFGGDAPATVHVKSLELAMSSLIFNAMGPLDNNVCYLGDGSITTNTPWKIVSDCPTGWLPSMEWSTSVLTFKPADGQGFLTLPQNPNSPGDFRVLYSFVFYLMALSLSHPVPYPIQGPPFMQKWPPNIINQTAISRGVLTQKNYEVNGLHGTQTFIS